MICLPHLHDLISLLHSAVVCRAVWLDSPHKDANIIAPHQPQTHTALFHKTNRAQI